MREEEMVEGGDGRVTRESETWDIKGGEEPGRREDPTARGVDIRLRSVPVDVGVVGAEESTRTCVGDIGMYGIDMVDLNATEILVDDGHIRGKL
jgi:hypothetical protein